MEDQLIFWVHRYFTKPKFISMESLVSQIIKTKSVRLLYITWCFAVVLGKSGLNSFTVQWCCQLAFYLQRLNTAWKIMVFEKRWILSRIRRIHVIGCWHWRISAHAHVGEIRRWWKPTALWSWHEVLHILRRWHIWRTEVVGGFRRIWHGRMIWRINVGALHSKRVWHHFGIRRWELIWRQDGGTCRETSWEANRGVDVVILLCLPLPSSRLVRVIWVLLTVNCP